MEDWRYAKIRRGDIGRRNGAATASYGGAGVPGDEKGASQHRSGYGISAPPAASIDAIYAAAYEVRDFRTMQMLDWFIREQGEEEKNAADLITKMELFGGDSKGLYMLNSELKARVYTAPSLVL